jgi:hypothetical protein
MKILMKSKTIKSLKLLLFTSISFSFLALMQVLLNIIQHHPAWLIYLPLLLLPIFLFLTGMISLDLINQDYVTLNGKLIEKIKLWNKSFSIKVSKDGGKIQKFRLSKDFAETLKELEVDQRIELQYLKRTKAVVYIGKITI